MALNHFARFENKKTQAIAQFLCFALDTTDRRDWSVVFVRTVDHGAMCFHQLGAQFFDEWEPVNPSGEGVRNEYNAYRARHA